MERMPQELYDKIASYVAKDSTLAYLAAVSPRWQATVERRTFRKVNLKSSDLDLFEQACCGKRHRHRHIKTVAFTVELPAYAQDRRVIFENDSDRLENNRVFTTQILRLLDILSSWTVEDGYIELRLDEAYSVADHSFMRWNSRSVQNSTFKPVEYRNRAEGEQDIITDLYNWRHTYSLLDLDPAMLVERKQIPQVPIISHFLKGPTTRSIADHVPVVLAAHCMPNVRVTSWRLLLWEIKHMRLIREYRALLTQAVVKSFLNLTSLEDLVFQMANPSPWAGNFIQGDISHGTRSQVSPWSNVVSMGEHSWSLTQGNELDSLSQDSHDSLSTALRIGLTQLPNLKRLIIGGNFDASLFTESPINLDQPENNHQEARPTTSNTWGASLEYLRVDLNVRRPQGGGYFRMAGIARWPPDPVLDGDEPRNDLSTETELPPGYTELSKQPSLTPTEPIATAQNFKRGDHLPHGPWGGFPVEVVADEGRDMSSFLAAFAHACARMPVLKWSSVSTWIPACIYDEDGQELGRERRTWGVWCMMPGEKFQDRPPHWSYWFRDPAYVEDSDARRVLWDTQSWRPSDTLRAEFAKIGAERYDGISIETFVELSAAQEREQYRKMKEKIHP